MTFTRTLVVLITIFQRRNPFINIFPRPLHDDSSTMIVSEKTLIRKYNQGNDRGSDTMGPTNTYCLKSKYFSRIPHMLHQNLHLNRPYSRIKKHGLMNKNWNQPCNFQQPYIKGPARSNACMVFNQNFIADLGVSRGFCGSEIQFLEAKP